MGLEQDIRAFEAWQHEMKQTAERHNMIAISTKYFDYNPDSKHFTAFASELPDDGNDKIELVSQWTDKRIVFQCRETLFDCDGDVTMWRYTPEDLAYSALSLTVYND